jgi:hypothetical protein
MASFGPARRCRDVEILDVAPLRLRFQNRCGLGLDRNLPFLDGYELKIFRYGANKEGVKGREDI